MSVEEIIAMFQTTKKSVVGEVQFVLSVTLRQLRQLIWKCCDVCVGTVDVKSGVCRSMDTMTTWWTVLRRLTDELV